ncbi:aminotransferase class I/II-fold pyridoxal phosphate-dependent enzyme [Pseudoalteromonas fenneropenaei]|uniref:8-amino-7-oxononanoate synthase n=1 Tax=Pseudoalteromonas fenneropenaei TaxID=1737459 RepID=A0ABV7CFH5_9GAMM
MAAFDFISEQLHARKADDLLRQRVCVQNTTARTLTVAGHSYLNFASNDYLGLGDSVAELKFAAASGAKSSALVTGYQACHAELESYLCELLGYEAAMLCNSGFGANVGVMKALFKDPKIASSSAVFQDKLNHASLIDGSLDGGAKLERFNHNDIGHLRSRLEKSKAAHKLIVTEGVFSMDGDSAPLLEIHALAKQHHAWLMVDDAHAFGVTGEHGLGSAQSIKPEILVITFGKAVGGQGACILGSKMLIDYLLQFNRDYIYSTAMSPLLATVNLVQLKRLQAAEQERQSLHHNIKLFRDKMAAAGLALMPSNTAIQPLVLGSAENAMQAQTKLKAKGIWLTAIRPPTVPFNTARLRITLTAKHQQQDIDTLVAALVEVL